MNPTDPSPDVDSPAHTLPDPATSPARLAVASWIHGGPTPGWRPPSLDPARPSAFGPIRVLELGAGAGENLLPLAFYDRQGSYVGLESDPGNLERARDTAALLGLSNVRFEAPGALPEEAAGPFDYIVVRDLLAGASDEEIGGIFLLCAELLAPEGLVVVDYPVMPGAAHEAFVRELLAPMAGIEGSKAARAERAGAGAKQLRELLARPEHPYPNLLGAELGRAASMPVHELWRRFAGGPRRAFFHREIAERAASHGLRFVCDAGWNRADAHVPPALRGELARLGLGGTDMEQALDIFCCRRARTSVFCRVDVGAAEVPGPAALDLVGIASPLAPEGEPIKLHPGVEVTFTGPGGERIGSVDPLLKAALLVLRDAWPRPVAFAEMVARAVALLHAEGAAGEPADEQLAGVARDLWTLHARGQVELFPAEPWIPRASRRALHALARHEAASRPVLTTPMHTLYPLQGFEAAVARVAVPGMDEEALSAVLMASIVSGAVPLELGGVRLTDPTLVAPMARGLLARSFATLGRWGLLEAEAEPASPPPPPETPPEP